MGDARHSFGVGSLPTAGTAERDVVFAALECVPQPIVLVDGLECIAFVNQHVVHTFGFAVVELVGQPFDRLVPGGLSRPGCAALADTVRHSQAVTAPVETDVVYRDGTSRPVLIEIGRLEADGGPFALCVLRETGARSEPRAGGPIEARLKEAQRIAKLGSWTWDLQTDEHWWSDELYRMLQIDPASESRPFERYLELIAPGDRERIAARTALVAKGESIEPIDVQVILPDGTRKVLQSQGAATLDASGQAIQLRGTLQDITQQQANEAALRRTEMRYREAQRLAKIGNWEWDLATNTSWWSDELYRILEEDPRDYAATFDNFLARVHPDDRQVLIEGQGTIAASPDAYRPTESRIVFPDGREKIVEQIVQARLDAHGRPVAIVGTVHDITERRALESKLRESETRYASTVELAAVGIAHVDVGGRFIWCNGRLREMLGYDNDEMLALTIWDISHPEDAHMADRDRPRLHAGEIETLTLEKRCLRKDSTAIWMRITTATRRTADRRLMYDVAILEDITARKSAEARVKYLATHDELTGLPNRTLFAELLQHAIETAKRYERRCAVLFIDLDRFKIVNDSLGHEAGDLLLQEVASRLRQCIRKSAVVGRLGGDEFVVLLEELPNTDAAAEVARRVLASMHAPVKIMGHECRVTVSIGIATYPDDAGDAATLMKHADLAMYLAKDEGKNNFQVYSSDMSPMSVEHLELEMRLAHALQRGEFSLQYQPRVDIATGRIRGAEALLRWSNPDLGAVPPARFIPLAEDTGLIVAIGKWVIRHACEQNVAWQKLGLPEVVMSVNLSPRQFKDPTLLRDIENILEETGMRPDLLELEITETMIMNHIDIAAEKAAAMKALGVKLAIDDFGTGYSSLSQLKRFPIDTLKIDRAFVRDIPHSVDDTAITRAVVSLGKALGVRVIAEGVETAAQYLFLRDNGCDEIQGFYFSKPCHPDAFAGLLKQPGTHRLGE
jgi:diguanylate cyclase (GGDEF)-like protein/PAS domain S-box-containing protein